MCHELIRGRKIFQCHELIRERKILQCNSIKVKNHDKLL